MKLAAHGQSDVGKVRSANQDAIRSHVPEDEIALREHGVLYAVADGMGGYEHGGVASAVALETFFDTYYSGPPLKSTQNMKRAVDQANIAVCQAAQRYNARMGTTLTAVSLIGRQVHIAHIGDSRVYLVRGRKPTCLTNDHTAVGELVRMKLLSPDKVRKHERRSVLEKCLGMQLFVQPDISTYSLSEDDYVILCTDGLWAFVEDEEFAEIALDIREPERISQALIELALDRDSDDNLSALVIHIEQLAALPAASSAPRGFSQLIRSRFGGKV